MEQSRAKWTRRRCKIEYGGLNDGLGYVSRPEKLSSRMQGSCLGYGQQINDSFGHISQILDDCFIADGVQY